MFSRDGVLQMYSQVCDGRAAHWVSLQCSREPASTVPHGAWRQFPFPATSGVCLLLSKSSPAFIACSLSDDGYSDWEEEMRPCFFI